MVIHLAEDDQVVQEHLHEARDEILEDRHDGALKSGGGYFQAEHHENCHINTLVCGEGCFFPIF